MQHGHDQPLARSGATSPAADRTAGIGELLVALRRHGWIIVLSVVLLGAGAYAASKAMEPEYSAQAKLLFRDPGFDQNLFGGAFFQNSRDPERAAATNRQLVELNAVYADASDELGATPADVRSSVSITANGMSDLVTVAATTPSPRRSAEMANAVARSFVRFRQNADKQKLREAQDSLREKMSAGDRTGSGTSLSSDISKLELLESVQTGNVEVVQVAAPPESPSAPRTRFNVAVAVGFGLLLGFVLVLARARLDRRLLTVQDISRATDLPIIGEVLRLPALEGEAVSSSPAARDAFIAMRSRLRYFSVDESTRSIVVASALSGEGKSTVSLNLAAASAMLGDRVLVIEADLRCSSFAARLGVEPSPGLSELLANRSADLASTVRAVDASPTGQSDVTFDILLAGGSPPNPQQLLASERMRALLAEAVEEYDLVLIDSPPLLQVSDAMPLAQAADGSVVVCRIGSTTRDDLTRLTRDLDLLGGRVLGIVANGVSPRAGTYGYGSYGDPPQRPATRSRAAAGELD